MKRSSCSCSRSWRTTGRRFEPHRHRGAILARLRLRPPSAQLERRRKTPIGQDLHDVCLSWISDARSHPDQTGKHASHQKILL